MQSSADPSYNLIDSPPSNDCKVMTNILIRADLNIQNQILSGSIEFSNGLNFISGENGTLKTKLLHFLRTEGAPPLHTSTRGAPLRRQAYSPRRNALRRTFNDIVHQLRRENIRLDNLINEKNINDASFENYPSLGDLYYVVYDHLCADGESAKSHMNSAAAEFNKVIAQVFPNYRLVAQWQSGAPSISIVKNNMPPIPIEGLSLGEQEILSLATNIYSSRDRYDVFLIDEPEVHLNWHLEEQLFNFFDTFCKEYRKQMIIVTHSRAVFKPQFLKRTQFLAWTDDGRVTISKSITAEQRRRIAGEAIEIIKLDAVSRPTFFVEDGRHALVISRLASKLGAVVSVTECGDKANVRSLFRLSKIDGAWGNSFFVEDGDNQGNPFRGESTFIHLDRYCIENYLIDIQILCALLGKNDTEVKELLCAAILNRKDKLFSKNKFFEFLVNSLKAADITEANLAKLDAAEVIEEFARTCGLDLSGYIDRYIELAISTNRLRDVFPIKIVNLLSNAIPPAETP